MIVTFVTLAVVLLGLCLLSTKRPSVKAIGYFLSAIGQFLNALMIREEGYKAFAYFVWVFVLIFLGAAADNVVKALSVSKVPPQAKTDGK